MQPNKLTGKESSLHAVTRQSPHAALKTQGNNKKPLRNTPSHSVRWLMPKKKKEVGQGEIVQIMEKLGALYTVRTHVKCYSRYGKRV